MEKQKKKIRGMYALGAFFISWFDKYRLSNKSEDYSIEDVGCEVIRTAGDQIDVLCATDSKNPLNQEISRKAKRNMFGQFWRGLLRGRKEVLDRWE